MDVKQFRLAHGLATKDVVAAVRREYPGYGKATHCMVENPSRYGVRLLPAAETALRERAGVRAGDRHRNRYRLACRVPEALHSAVKQAVEADERYASVSDLIYTLITRWLKRQKKAAPGGNDTQDGNMENNTTVKIPQEGGEVNGLQ